MEIEERPHNAELLGNIQTHLKAIVETCGSLTKRQDETIEWLHKLDAGQRRLDDGLHKVEDRLHKVEDGLHKLEGGQRKLEDGQRKLEDGQRKLEDRLHKVEDGLHKVEDGLHKLEDQQDVLLGRVDRMEIRFELKFDELEVFASDAQQRLKRIETHLQLSGPSHVSPRRKATRDESSKRGKKS
jgi:uncharacterized phage infection (PIP) family protein YhgE